MGYLFHSEFDLHCYWNNLFLQSFCSSREAWYFASLEMRSFAHIPITLRAISVIAVFCCTWSEAHVLTASLARNSWTLCSFSLVFVFGLYFDFLQNKHWSGRIAELTSFLSLERLLGAIPVAALSDGSLTTCKSLLLVNSARQLRWYFMGFAGNSVWFVISDHSSTI